MPAKMRKLPRSTKYRVYDGSRIASYSTSKTNAEKQVRLLNGLKHGSIRKP